MAIYRRNSVFWWKSRVRSDLFADHPITVRLSLRTANSRQARSRAAELDVARIVVLEHLTILRKEVRVDDLPKLYKRAFERELERIILAQILEPSLSDQCIATNIAYARYFTLLATEPSLVLGEKALDELPDDLPLPTAEAKALLEIIKRHRNGAAVSHRIVADDLRELGIKASERNLAVSARVTASLLSKRFLIAETRRTCADSPNGKPTRSELVRTARNSFDCKLRFAVRFP